MQFSAIDELSGEIAIPEEYLKSKRAPLWASGDPDRFYKQQ
jgi:hypothetical protein